LRDMNCTLGMMFEQVEELKRQNDELHQIINSIQRTFSARIEREEKRVEKLRQFVLARFTSASAPIPPWRTLTQNQASLLLDTAMSQLLGWHHDAN